MSPTENRTVELNIFTHKVENYITNHILQFEKRTYCTIFFNLLQIPENYDFLYIPLVKYLYFEMAPKENQTVDVDVDFLDIPQIN